MYSALPFLFPTFNPSSSDQNNKVHKKRRTKVFAVSFFFKNNYHLKCQSNSKEYIWNSPVLGDIFHWDFPFFRLSLMAPNLHGNGISLKFQKPVLVTQCLPQKIEVSAFRHNLGCAPYAWNWVFFFKLWNSTFLFSFLLSS